jgi:hypothetical protein
MAPIAGTCAFLIEPTFRKCGGLTENIYLINLEIVSLIGADSLELEER